MSKERERFAILFGLSNGNEELDTDLVSSLDAAKTEAERLMLDDPDSYLSAEVVKVTSVCKAELGLEWKDPE